MDPRPVLYLDLDDTLVAWQDDRPRGASGAGEFLRWALDAYEVRWLTTWCPDGRMEERLLRDLATMMKMPVDALRGIRGMDWSGGSKLDGIAWVEHAVMGRPFVWLEDDYGVGDAQRRFLEAHGWSACYRHVNVSEDPDSLGRVHRALRADVARGNGGGGTSAAHPPQTLELQRD